MRQAKKKEQKKKVKKAPEAPATPRGTGVSQRSQERRKNVIEAKKGDVKSSALDLLKAKREEKKKQIGM